MAIQNCPMGRDWRNWDLSTEARFKPSNPEARAAITRARKARQGERLRQVEVVWETAPDDASYQPAPEGSHFLEGSPSHIHTEFEIDGELVHIDRLHVNKFAPGRSYTEFRIFVNGKLAGRGGSAGTSLGGGGSDLPAVALVGKDKVLTVDKQAIITLWKRL